MKHKKTIKPVLKIITIMCALLLVIGFAAACSRTYEVRVTNSSATLPSSVTIGSVDFGSVAASVTTNYESFDNIGPHTVKLNGVPSTSEPAITFNPLAGMFGGDKKTVTIDGPDITKVSVNDD
jgi:hypothetical protein